MFNCDQVIPLTKLELKKELFMQVVTHQIKKKNKNISTKGKQININLQFLYFSIKQYLSVTPSLLAKLLSLQSLLHSQQLHPDRSLRISLIQQE